MTQQYFSDNERYKGLVSRLPSKRQMWRNFNFRNQNWDLEQKHDCNRWKL